ncbi:MAG TPA: AsmA family protein, partial [Cyclobacteriaceae bacterium]
MKKVLIVAAGIIAVILVAIPVIFFVFKDEIRATAEREINKQINGSVSFCDLHISILRDFPNCTIILEDVVVKGKGEFVADTLARANELNIELKTSSLLGGNAIEVKSVNVVRPVIHLELLKDGNSNYMSLIKLTPSTTEPTANPTNEVTLSLDEISIENGQLYYQDDLDNLYMHVDGLHYSGKGDFKNDVFDLQTKTEIKSLTFDYGAVRYLAQKQVWADMILSVNMATQKYTLKENTIQINHFKFGIDGAVTVLDNAFDIDLKFKTKETAFKNILSLIPGVFMEDIKQIKTSGDLAFDGYVKGRYATDTLPPFMVNVKVSNAMFKIDTLPSPVENIQLDLVVKNNYFTTDSLVFDLKAFHVDMMNHPIHGRFMIKGFPEYFIDTDIMADLDLEQLEKMYPIKGFDMKGKLKGELKARGIYRVALSHDSLNHHNLAALPVFSTNLTVTDGKFQYDSLPRALENVNFHLTASNKTGKLEHTFVDVKNFHLDFDKNPIHGFIKISGYNDYTLDTDIKATIDLEDLEKIYPIDNVVMKGLLNVDIESKGIYSANKKKFPLIDAVLSLNNGYLKTSDMPEPLEHVHFQGEAKNTTGNWRNTSFMINQLTYTLENEPFSVKGSLSDLENYNYDLTIKGLIDLEKLSKIYPVKGFRLKGLLDTDMEAKGSVADIEAGHYDNIKSTGSLEIKNLEVSGSALPEAVRIDDALFTFTPTKIVLDRFKGEFGKSNLKISGSLTNYMAFATRTDDVITGDLNLICDTLDLNVWNKPAPVKSGSAKVKTVAASKQASTTAWMVPRNINFKFDSEIAHAYFMDMDISKLNGEIKINDGVLSLHETGFNSLNASFNLSGDYDTRNVVHPTFDFDLNIKELDINKAYKEIKLVRDLVPAAEHTFGQLSVDYKLKGELTSDMIPKTETLIGGGEVQIANAQINGMKIFEEISKAA